MVRVVWDHTDIRILQQAVELLRSQNGSRKALMLRRDESNLSLRFISYCAFLHGTSIFGYLYIYREKALHWKTDIDISNDGVSGVCSTTCSLRRPKSCRLCEQISCSLHLFHPVYGV